MIVVGTGGATISLSFTFSFDMLFIFLLLCFVLLLIFSSVVLCILTCILPLVGIYDLRLLVLFLLLFAVGDIVRTFFESLDLELSPYSDLPRRTFDITELSYYPAKLFRDFSWIIQSNVEAYRDDGNTHLDHPEIIEGMISVVLVLHFDYTPVLGFLGC